MCCQLPILWGIRPIPPHWHVLVLDGGFTTYDRFVYLPISIESETRLFSKADREALGQYVIRGAPCAEKIQYDQDSDTVIWTASPKGFYKGKSETFKGFEFVDQLVAHLPPRRVQLVRHYGVYAGKVRKQWQERPSIYCPAPEGWQKEHSNKFPIVEATLPEDASIVEAPDAWSKLRKQS